MSQLNLDTSTNKKGSDSPFVKELKKFYIQLMKEKAEIEDKLAALKELVMEKAPELLVSRTTLKWDYQPGIHKLPKDFFKLDSAKVTQVYKSAIGGGSFLNKYGLSYQEATNYSWKPLNKEGKN